MPTRSHPPRGPRRYVRSRSDVQLAKAEGSPPETNNCEPLEFYAGDPSRLIDPCGLIAWSYFNDTYTVRSSWHESCRMIDDTSVHFVFILMCAHVHALLGQHSASTRARSCVRARAPLGRCCPAHARTFAFASRACTHAAHACTRRTHTCACRWT